MLEWIHANGSFLGWLGALSAATFVGSLVVIPILVARIPSDYFTRATRSSTLWKEAHPAVRGFLLVLKNGAGVVFVIAGIAMLVLPGQGILTILIGVMLLDFPGKFNLERWLVCKPTVLRAINWIRSKAHRRPLEAPACWLAARAGESHESRDSSLR